MIKYSDRNPIFHLKKKLIYICNTCDWTSYEVLLTLEIELWNLNINLSYTISKVYLKDN